MSNSFAVYLLLARSISLLVFFGSIVGLICAAYFILRGRRYQHALLLATIVGFPALSYLYLFANGRVVAPVMRKAEVASWQRVSIPPNNKPRVFVGGGERLAKTLVAIGAFEKAYGLNGDDWYSVERTPGTACPETLDDLREIGRSSGPPSCVSATKIGRRRGFRQLNLPEIAEPYLLLLADGDAPSHHTNEAGGVFASSTFELRLVSDQGNQLVSFWEAPYFDIPAFPPGLTGDGWFKVSLGADHSPRPDVLRFVLDGVGHAALLDRLISRAREEKQRAAEAQAQLRLEAARADCNAPTLPSGVKMIFLGAGEGKALSNAWVGTEDRVTYVTTVEIEPGSELLYLALASGVPMIWDVVGATERIAGVLVHGDATIGAGKPLVGIVGIPREKVRFTAHPRCLVPPMATPLEDGSAAKSAALLLGHAVDEIGGELSAGTFRIPTVRHFSDLPVRNSMKFPTNGLGESLWRDVRDTFPAGVAQIDVGSVISLHPVKPYSVLPERAGLAELVDTGTLTIAGISHGVRIDGKDVKPFTLPNSFRISTKLRLPAGAASTFVLPRDIPPPEGDLHAACVLSEVDMKPITGSRAGCS